MTESSQPTGPTDGRGRSARLPEGRRYASLDHWRGLACLAVLVNHSVWYRSGTSAEVWLHDLATRLWVGVPVFFVISGYCISAAADAQRFNASRPLRDYFKRRLRRIFPPWWATLGLTAVIVGVVDVLLPGDPLSKDGIFLRPWWYDVRQWFGNLTLTEQWRFHVWPGQKAWILGHAWTLAYEEQFYVVVGLLIWLVPARFFSGAAVVSAGVAAAAVAAPMAGMNVEGFFWDGSWLQFWFGVLLYQVLNYGSSRSRILLGVLLLGVMAGSAVDPSRLMAIQKTSEQAFFVAAAFALVALGMRRLDDDVMRTTWLAPIRVCGVMCYSLYLVHLPIVNFIHAAFLSAGLRPRPIVSLAVCAPVSIALAWGFHLAVERRFLNTPVVGGPGNRRGVSASGLRFQEGRVTE